MAGDAPQLPPMNVGETRAGAVGFLNTLDSGELLNGTPTVVSSPTGPTITNVAVNTGTLTIDGVSHVAGQAVQFLIADVSANILYSLTVTSTTDDGQTFKKVIQFRTEG